MAITTSEPLTREIALQLNAANCTDSMRFTPQDGYCWSCKADLVPQYGLKAIADGLNVTGCRKCHRSFCD